MNVQKICIVAIGFTLLAAGCSKTKTETQTPSPAATGEVTNAPINIAKELDPSQNWIRFYPSETVKLNLLFPLTWFGDEENDDTHFVLRTRKGADGSKVDDVIMDFTVANMTAKTLTDQFAADMKGSKDASPITTTTTDSGTTYSFATYVSAAGAPTLGVAVPYQGGQYIRLKVTGNVAHPYVGRMIQSITITK